MNPGSNQAIKDGCSCPALDNARGCSHLGDGEKYGWWTNDDCPLHGQTKSLESKGFEKEEA